MGRLQDSFKAYITSGADAVASDLATGKIAYGADGRIIGTAALGGIQFVSSTEVAYAAMGATPTTYTINKPANVIAGDLVILLVGTRNSLLTGYATGFTGVSYFGALTSSIETPPSASNDVVRVQYKFLTGSEGATFEIEATDDGDDYICMLCVAFRGVGQTPTFSTITGGTSISPSMAGNEGDVLLSIIGTIFDPTVLDAASCPPNMMLAGLAYNAVSDIGHAVCMEHLFSTGATGTRTWGAQWNDYEWAFSVLLQP